MKKAEEYSILIVDDEEDICRALKFLLTMEGYSVKTALSGKDALDKIKKVHFDLVLSDLKMEGMDGLELLRAVKKQSPSTVFVMMTAYASVENAVEAMKSGASDYIVKPFVNEDVKLRIKRLLEHRRLKMENEALRRQISQRLDTMNFIGHSVQMQAIFNTLERVIPTRSNVLILGESGTGKEVIAEIIHKNSPRRDSPFMSINCSAIPDNLLESELFGYKKGAFTGASSDKPGILTLANGGTLFLDEIGDMPVHLQTKLLKFLETSEVFPLGDTRSHHVDVRVISATNKNLEELVKEGKFRDDLYYRLNVIEIKLPPLRERKDDIPLLVNHFIEKFCNENNRTMVTITDEALECLKNYNWPGNIRELRNVIERAVILCPGDTITLDDIPEKIKYNDVHSGTTLRERLNFYEKKILLESLAKHGWNKEEVAKELEIDLATLYRKMKRLNIQ